MDPRKYMIIDTEAKDEYKRFITEQLEYYKYDGGLIKLKFRSSDKIYPYRKDRILFLEKPTPIDVANHHLYYQNERQNIAELYSYTHYFQTYYYAVYPNKSGKVFTDNQVYLSRTVTQPEGSIWHYLNHLAAEIGLELGNEEKVNALQKYYERTKVESCVPLYQYVGGERSLSKQPWPQQIIYPFGINASQKAAVENALTNQVSIIQGPPGTGKTQTILNIVANLLLSGKTVLIVSNNNSAVENVAEKLSSEKVNLGWLVSQLGSNEKKNAFFIAQDDYPDISEWKQGSALQYAARVKNALQTIEKSFAAQQRLAELQAAANALEKEIHYREEYDNPLGDIQIKGTSKTILKDIARLKRELDGEQQISLWTRFIYWIRYGKQAKDLLCQDRNQLIAIHEAAYYRAKEAEIKAEIEQHNAFLKSIDTKTITDELVNASLDWLHFNIAQLSRPPQRQVYSAFDLKHRGRQFLADYPMVLSTTFSATNCFENMLFDYIIMDEASQIDLMTGALTLSCATHAVIVGDDKQLPNVIDSKTFRALTVIEENYQIAEAYRSTTHSFLQSCCDVFKDAPVTLLREHYRCHPKIIEFCNGKFYDGALVTMTQDKGEPDVLKVIRTAPGNHAREHLNQREIDVICQEIMPTLPEDASVGIITPYRVQAEAINAALGQDIASTVHKFQGRECDTIIMSLVDNSPTSFSDDPNLLNVAISRAKKRLYVVTTGNTLAVDTIIAQLVGYISYNRFEVVDSRLHSVFDLLYKPYTEERLAYETAHKKVSDEISENIIYNTIQEALQAVNKTNTDILCHYPLSRLIASTQDLTDEEAQFATHPLSHIDFLLYNRLTKQPLIAIEVDGWTFHKQAGQQQRDRLKDEVLRKSNLPLLRLQTTEIVTVETLSNVLRNIQ